MTVLAHWESEDWVSTAAWPDRVNAINVIDHDGSAHSTKGTSPFRADTITATLRKSIGYPSAEQNGPRVLVDSSPFLVPAPGQVRTYEVIMSHADPVVGNSILASGDGANSFFFGLGSSDDQTLFDMIKGGVETQYVGDLVTVAPDSFHYWTCVLNLLVPASSYVKVYHGKDLVLSQAIANATGWTVQSAGGPFDFAVSFGNQFSVIGAMVHDIELTAAQVKLRTTHLRSFG